MFDDNSYYQYKIFELLLVESNLDEWVNNNLVLSSYDFLEMFLDFINIYLDEDYLGPSMKNNVLNYLNLVRFKGYKDVKKIELINYIIRLINVHRGNKYLDYYRYEMYKRTGNDDYLKYPFDMITVNGEEKLFKSMQYDQFVLLSHSEEIDDEEFDCDFLNDLSSNMNYFESINCMLYEYPRIFCNDLFVERFNKVVNVFLKKSNQDNYYSSVLSFNNKINKLIKSYKF